MEINNPLYKNIGIHVIATIFTIDNSVVKVLLIKRKNNPYNGMWALVGGAMYNNEKIDKAIKREIFEKTGIKDIELYFSSFIDDIERSPLKRMVALNYIGVIDNKRVNYLKETMKTSDADWVSIDKIPKLAYDHNKIIDLSKITLSEKIVESNILKSLYPDGFTIPEIQKVYEVILNKNFDRRNFRKKLLSFEFIIDTNEYKNFKGKKPAKVYKFDEKYKQNKNLF